MYAGRMDYSAFRPYFDTTAYVALLCFKHTILKQLKQFKKKTVFGLSTNGQGFIGNRRTSSIMVFQTCFKLLKR